MGGMEAEASQQTSDLTGLLRFVCRSDFPKLDNTPFRKMDLFPKNAVFWDVAPCGSCKNRFQRKLAPPLSGLQESVN
jgi:hypothetical protein